MTIMKRVVFEDGWKQMENDRKGQCVVVEFFNDADGKVLFKYAPRHTEKEFWESFFKTLWDYDIQIKKFLHLNTEEESKNNKEVCK